MISNDIKRWYDRDPRMVQILDLLQGLPEDSQNEFARVLMQLINLLKKNKKDANNMPLSIGKTKVLGLYKAFNKRRWYDQNNTLMNSLNILSTMDDDDFNTIVEGVSLSLAETYK